MIILVTKKSLIKVNSFLLILALAFTACKSSTEEGSQTKNGNEQTSLSLKHTVIDMVDKKTGSTFSVELDYPEGWNTEMVSSNVFYASENPEAITDGYANNFHAIVFNDSLNHDIKRYSNNFLIKEQSKFPQMHFEVVRSENIKGKKGIPFQIDQIKIWGGSQDTLFSISALAKMNRRVVHLNFYGNYDEKEGIEMMAKNIVSNVQITE